MTAKYSSDQGRNDSGRLMMRFLKGFLPGVLALLSVPGLGQDSFGDKGVVSGNRVRIRANANLSGTILGSLNAGQEVEVLGVGDEVEIIGKPAPGCAGQGFRWYLIKMPGGKAGWIYGQYLYQVREEELYEDMMENYPAGQFRYGMEFYGKKGAALIGCNYRYMPYFSIEKGKKGYPFIYEGEVLKLVWKIHSNKEIVIGYHVSYLNPDAVTLETQYYDTFNKATGFRYYLSKKEDDHFKVIEVVDTGWLY